MYKKVDNGLDFVAREKEVLDFWKENHIFEKSVEKNVGNPEFSFFDGPPTANGRPHIGHILTRVMKDIIPRYKTMKGYHVLRKAGWDTHGLPVELEVEKQLHIDGKQETKKYGIEPFIKQCKESVWKYKHEWEVMSDRVGYWADMENPYVTYDDNYIESVWWSLKEIDKKGLLYKGYKIVPYCPRCGTALSSHEVAQGYKDVKERSVFVRFRLVDEENTSFLAWTTTPWTLPSNVALCMNAKEDYAKIKVGDEYFIMAKALIPSLFKEDEYELVSVKKGKDYEYTKYKSSFRLRQRHVEGLVCHERRLRHSYGRHRRRTHRARIRRRRRAGRQALRLAFCEIRGRPRQTHRRRLRLQRSFRERRRSSHYHETERNGIAVQGYALRTQLPVLLALRHSAYLLRTRKLVH